MTLTTNRRRVRRPGLLIHSYTDDPTFSDIVYAGHIKRMTVQELKRLAGSELSRGFTEDCKDRDEQAR